MNKTKTIYFLSAIVLIIGCYALNLSYSLFVQTESKDIVNATVPVLSYNLEQRTFVVPANSSELITLKINNTGTTDMNYGISTRGLKAGDTVQLVKKVDNNIIGTVASSSSKEVLVYVTNTDGLGAIINFDLTATYSTVAIAEDFVSTSHIDTVNTVKLFSDTIIANAKSTELTYENKTVYSETLQTIPAKEANDENERLLLETEDDYTATTGQNSYYFRGNVIDNYVNFAGMCWRIVRIQGDGSIKLILDDRNEQCNDKIGQDLNNNGTYYTGNWSDGNLYEYSFSLNLVEPGIDYGTINFFDGELADSFKTFQINKLSTYLTRLKADEWCYDNFISEVQGPTVNLFYAGSYTRLISHKKPSLKCEGTILSDEMYVGTLTADEISFAGAVAYDGYESTKDNFNFYLTNESSNLKWTFATLSPYGILNNLSTEQLVFSMIYNGTLYPVSIDGRYRSRPAVTLRSGTIVTTNPDTTNYGEPGTITNPYVVE